MIKTSSICGPVTLAKYVILKRGLCDFSDKVSYQNNFKVKFVENVFHSLVFERPACTAVCRLSLSAASRGYSLAAVHGLLIMVASLC